MVRRIYEQPFFGNPRPGDTIQIQRASLRAVLNSSDHIPHFWDEFRALQNIYYPGRRCWLGLRHRCWWFKPSQGFPPHLWYYHNQPVSIRHRCVLSCEEKGSKAAWLYLLPSPVGYLPEQLFSNAIQSTAPSRICVLVVNIALQVFDDLSNIQH